MFLSVDDGDRAVLPADRDRATGRPTRRGTSLRSISVAFVVASVLGLIAIPFYLDSATAVDSLRSVWDVGALVPLFRVTAFGRGYVDLEICFALFCVAAWVALWVDRPERENRSIAEILAGLGALGAAAAVLLVPGASGPRGADRAARVSRCSSTGSTSSRDRSGSAA